MNFIKLKIAESWVAAHKSKYKGFHKWADNVGRIASHRGWTNTQLGRVRWVNEENSKGNEGGLERLAVSAQIQGCAADQGKLALVLLYKKIWDTPCKLIGFVH